MKANVGTWMVSCAIFSLLLVPMPQAQNHDFHDAPDSAKATKNPFASQKAAIAAGHTAYTQNCGACHGVNGVGTGNIPSLAKKSVQSVADGEIFWFITKGDISNGMPAWDKMPEEKRWQIVTYVKSLHNARPSAASAAAPAATTAATLGAPAPAAPFEDYRFEKPGKVRKITVQDLPAPFATPSAPNAPHVVARPEKAWPQAPAGFKVEQYTTGLNNPRLIRTAPNGDFFVAESDPGDIKIFRGFTKEGHPAETYTFATGLNRPYGIAFYPPGPDPQWLYIGNTDSVVRFAYHNGDVKAQGEPQHIADLPYGGGHWTRDIRFTPDGKKMYVGVGSSSNIDDPDDHPKEKNRADILEFNPDGSGQRVYASGIRNPGGGLEINPTTGELWCSVNERDGLGDDLVPDYITHVQDGGFYGWPWWYMGDHQDPRHEGKHPELKDKVIVPDVLLHPHNASLEFAFYEGAQFPAGYKGDIFAAEHGSWNKAVRVGYEVVRIPLHQTGHATGEYEDFLTGFVVDNGHVWGRPVGVTVAPDGSLLVTDDGSNSIWRVIYTKK